MLRQATAKKRIMILRAILIEETRKKKAESFWRNCLRLWVFEGAAGLWHGNMWVKNHPTASGCQNRT